MFGLIFCGFLYIKGLAVPSGAGVQPDCGPSGYGECLTRMMGCAVRIRSNGSMLTPPGVRLSAGPVFDYYWGMELYPVAAFLLVQLIPG